MDRFSDRNKHKSEFNDENNGDKDSSQIHDIENCSNNSQEATDEYLKKRISAHIENNNNEIDIDDFIDDICGSDYYEKIYNNKEETNIQANSKSNRSSETKNKKDGLLNALRMIKQDKCPRCGARKTSVVVFSGVRGDQEMTLKCEQCGTNISACTGVLPIEDLNSK